ncbi:MAG TPA: DNA helicase RecQ [Phycisphaerae bacterium]|mgnify:FL=1|nr:DNA helicase RecQ [Phycisphaerae bacterium]
MGKAGTLAIPTADILEAVQRCWGFNSLRPLQAQAIQAELEHRDSLVVLPTGGGKSLCYQAPPLVAGRTDVVVSPLISLMKDQVDALRTCGYPAAAIYGKLPLPARLEIEREVMAGLYRLILLAPERLLAPDFLDLLDRVSVRAFAIDEAHCISHWGHDFRKEYRQLAVLRKRFPNASLHAYTATATQRVRDDIAAQLGLRDPLVLVGDFDRANLVYRVIPRMDLYAQVLEVLARHRGEAVIVYCISRKDTETLATRLVTAGVRAAYYHAGMDAEHRRRTQDAFSHEKLDVIVATVAFGMGIDRSDVRCVIHAAMPKSVEHYQQETGRAGRDGLPAECILFYSPADAFKWESLIRKSAEEAGAGPQVVAAALDLLAHMRGYCAAPICRHRFLVEYFGQQYTKDNCGACERCLDEVEADDEANVLAQKILSCVARVEQRFGVGHVVKVLQGANDRQVRLFGHDRLSTYGLLKEYDAKIITNFTYQLIEQGVLDRTPGDRPILKLNAASWRVLRGEQNVRLVRPKARPLAPTQVEIESWEGVDRQLYESLRGLRNQIAAERGVPAFIILGNATLRDMARRRPTTPAEFLQVHGIGEQRLREFGARFLEHIRATVGARGTVEPERVAGEGSRDLGIKGSRGAVSPQRPASRPKM